MSELEKLIRDKAVSVTKIGDEIVLSFTEAEACERVFCELVGEGYVSAEDVMEWARDVNECLKMEAKAGIGTPIVGLISVALRVVKGALSPDLALRNYPEIKEVIRRRKSERSGSKINWDFPKGIFP